MKRVLTFFLSFFLFGALSAQVLINQIWTASSAEAGTIPPPPPNSNWPWSEVAYSKPTLLSSGDFFVAGNILQNSGYTDIMLSKYNSEGQMEWQQTFAGNAGKNDYGIALTSDNDGNLLLLGVLTTSNSTSDFIALKYDNAGNLLWYSAWDGGNNQLDLPTTIVTDDSGYIYVAGGTVDLSGQADWKIFKLSPNGSMLWNMTYNYDNEHDMPVLLSPKAGSLEVYGFSGKSNGSIGGTTGEVSWDAVKLELSLADGSMLSEKRQNLPNLLSSEVVAMREDANANLYLAFSSADNNGSSDIKLMKLDAAFDSLWLQTIDADDQADKVRALALDNEGNPVLAGISHYAVGGTQITLSKFSPSGNIIFNTAYRPPYLAWGVDVSKMKINDEGDIFLAGFSDREDSRDALLLMYDQAGQLRVEKYYDGENASDDTALGFAISNSGEIFLSGQSEGIPSAQFAVKYQYVKRAQQVVLVDSVPHHVAQEVIVRFLPQYVDSSFVDNRELRYGSLYEALSDEAASFMESRMDYLRQTTFVKVFPRLTTAHTQSISRLGDTIAIPPFWATYVLLLPQAENPDSVVAQFEVLTDYVEYAELNYIGRYFFDPPNDPFYPEQGSLHPYPSINVESAWDFETGKDYVRVGVLDNIAFWAHEDFGDGTGTFEGSVFSGGRDFISDIPLSSIPVPSTSVLSSHGTAVSGIIGAIRNNGIGIAGIAGGDATQGNKGVSLYSLGVGTDAPILSACIEAVVEGALGIEDGGYALHLENISWAFSSNTLSLQNAVEFAWRNHCIIIAVRGNEGTSALRYPAGYVDPFTLSVGASGNDGKRYKGDNGESWRDPYYEWASNLLPMDFMAPGITDLVLTTIYPNAPLTSLVPNYPPPVGNGSYQVFSGTSAAAPHISGIAALMYSLHNIMNPEYPQLNNLAIEDVEYLLENTAFFTDYPFRLVTANAALERVEGPALRVQHNSEPETSSMTFIESLELPGGVVLKKYKITHNYHDVIPPGHYLLAWWSRPSSTFGLAEDDWGVNTFSETFHASYNASLQGNDFYVTAITYQTEVTYPSGEHFFIPEKVKTAYSINLYNSSTSSLSELTKIMELEVVPNPTMDFVRMFFQLPQGSYAENIRLYTLEGYLLLQKEINSNSGDGIYIDLRPFPTGMYIVQLKTNLGPVSCKVIKQ